MSLKYEGLFAGTFFIRVSPLGIKKLIINSSIYSASEAWHSAHGSFGKVCKINDVLLTVVIR